MKKTPNENRQVVQVVAAVLEEKGKVLIAQRRPDERYPGKWEFPGGKIQAHETEEDALIREIEEELGACLKVQEKLDSVSYDYGDIHVAVQFFRGRLAKGAKVNCNSHAQLKWVPRKALLEYDFLAADLAFIEKLAKR